MTRLFKYPGGAKPETKEISKKSGPDAAGEGRGESWRGRSWRGRVANGTRMGRTCPGRQEERGRDWSAARLFKNHGRAKGQTRRRAAGAGRGRGEKGTEQQLAFLGNRQTEGEWNGRGRGGKGTKVWPAFSQNSQRGRGTHVMECGPGATAGEGSGLNCNPPF